MFHRTPGYPTFIALAFFLLGQQTTAIIYLQILLSAIPPLCAYFIANKLVDRRVALVAASLMIGDYLWWGFTYMILTDFLFAVVISLSLYLGVLIFTNPHFKYRVVFLLGCSLAIATLIRPVGYLLVFPVGGGVMVYLLYHRCSVRRLLLSLVMLLLASILLVGGWQVRNKIVFNTFQYTELIDFHNASVFFPENYQRYLKDYPQEVLPLAANSGQLSLRQRIKPYVELLFHYPLLTARVMSVGALKLLLGGVSSPLTRLFGYLDEIVVATPAKQALLHIRIWRAIELSQEFHVHWQSIALVFTILASNALLYFFIFIGVMISRTRPLIFNKRTFFAHLFLVGVVFYFLLFSANAAAYERFRLPFQIILDFYAAVGVVILIRCFSSVKSKPCRHS